MKYEKGWEEFKRDSFVRYDKETGVWVTMQIHYFFPNARIYSQGRTKREAKDALKSAIELWRNSLGKEPSR